MSVDTASQESHVIFHEVIAMLREGEPSGQGTDGKTRT